MAAELSRSDIDRELRRLRAELEQLGDGSADEVRKREIRTEQDALRRKRRELDTPTGRPEELQPPTVIPRPVLPASEVPMDAEASVAPPADLRSPRATGKTVDRAPEDRAPRNVNDSSPRDRDRSTEPAPPRIALVDLDDLEAVVRHAIEEKRLNDAERYVREDAETATPRLNDVVRQEALAEVEAGRVRLRRLLGFAIDEAKATGSAQVVTDHLVEARRGLPGLEVDEIHRTALRVSDHARKRASIDFLRTAYELEKPVSSRNTSEIAERVDVNSAIKSIELPASDPQLEAELQSFRKTIQDERERRTSARSAENTVGLTSQYFGLLRLARDSMAAGQTRQDLRRLVLTEGRWVLQEERRDVEISEVIARYEELAAEAAERAAGNRIDQAGRLLNDLGDIDGAVRVLNEVGQAEDWQLVGPDLRATLDRFRTRDLVIARDRLEQAGASLSAASGAPSLDDVERHVGMALDRFRFHPRLTEVVSGCVVRLASEVGAAIDLARQNPRLLENGGGVPTFRDQVARIEALTIPLPAVGGSMSFGPRETAVDAAQRLRQLVDDFEEFVVGRQARLVEWRDAHRRLREWIEDPKRVASEGRDLLQRLNGAVGIAGSKQTIASALRLVGRANQLEEVEDAIRAREPQRALDLIEVLVRDDDTLAGELSAARRRATRLQEFLKVRVELGRTLLSAEEIGRLSPIVDRLVVSAGPEGVITTSEATELTRVFAEAKASSRRIETAIVDAESQLRRGVDADFAGALGSVDQAIEAGVSSSEIIALRQRVLGAWWNSLTASLDASIDSKDADGVKAVIDTACDAIPQRQFDAARKARAFALLIEAASVPSAPSLSHARRVEALVATAAQVVTPETAPALDAARATVARARDVPAAQEAISHGNVDDALASLRRAAAEGVAQGELAALYCEAYLRGEQWEAAAAQAELIPAESTRIRSRERVAAARNAHARLAPVLIALAGIEQQMRPETSASMAEDLRRQVDYLRREHPFPEATARIDDRWSVVREMYVQAQREEIVRGRDGRTVQELARPFLKLRAVGSLSEGYAEEFRRLLLPLRTASAALHGEVGRLGMTIRTTADEWKQLGARIDEAIDGLTACESEGDPTAVTPALRTLRQEVSRSEQLARDFHTGVQVAETNLDDAASREDLGAVGLAIQALPPRFRGPPAHPSFARVQARFRELMTELDADEALVRELSTHWNRGDFQRCSSVAVSAVTRLREGPSRFRLLETAQVVYEGRSYTGIVEIHRASESKHGHHFNWLDTLRRHSIALGVPQSPNPLEVRAASALEAVTRLASSFRPPSEAERRAEPDRWRSETGQALETIAVIEAIPLPQDPDGLLASAQAAVVAADVDRIRRTVADARIARAAFMGKLDEDDRLASSAIAAAMAAEQEVRRVRRPWWNPFGSGAGDAARGRLADAVAQLEAVRPRHPDLSRLRDLAGR